MISADPKNIDGATPVLDLTAPAQQHLRAVAGNYSGAQINNVHVQIWALAFAVAAAPSLYLASMGGIAGTTVPAGAGRSLTATPQAFDANEAGEWYPRSNDPQIISHFSGTDVHCCMQANVFSVIGDKITNPLTQLHPDTERRHAQHNMTIKPRTPGLAVNIDMLVANPDVRREQKAVVTIEEILPRQLQAAQLKQIAQLTKRAPFVATTKAHLEGSVVPGLQVAVGKERLPLQLAKPRSSATASPATTRTRRPARPRPCRRSTRSAACRTSSRSGPPGSRRARSTCVRPRHDRRTTIASARWSCRPARRRRSATSARARSSGRRRHARPSTSRRRSGFGGRRPRSAIRRSRRRRRSTPS